FGEAARCQVVGVPSRRGLPDLQEPLFHTALQVRIDKPEGDAEFGRKPALRMDAAPLDRHEQAQEDAGILDALLVRNPRHANPSTTNGLGRSLDERQAYCS